MRYIHDAYVLAANPDDPDGQWLLEASKNGYDIGEVDGCYVPLGEEVAAPGEFVKEIRLAQYIGGRLFIETATALIDDKQIAWVATASIG